MGRLLKLFEITAQLYIHMYEGGKIKINNVLVVYKSFYEKHTLPLNAILI